MNEADVFWDNADAGIEDYEDLLCKKDQLVKESESLQISYTLEFGELITEIFEKKVECIKKKKMITFCQKSINRGERIDIERMTVMVDRDMQLYYYQLDELIRQNKEARDSKTVDPFRIRRSKKLYRRLAKILHPDINGKTVEEPVLRELWEHIADAYRRSDVEALEDLEVLVGKAMDEFGLDGFEYDIDDLEERIARVQEQIAEILTTEPYAYREILYDDEKKAELKKQLEAEKEEYVKYAEELTETLDQLLSSGGMSFIWKMN